MLKYRVSVIVILSVFCLAGLSQAGDLTPGQLREMLSRVEQQKFDTRDAENNRIENRNVREEAAGIFKLVERLQNLKARIDTPTVFGTVLTRNNLIHNASSERSNLFSPFFNIRVPETVWTIVRDKKSFMLSSLPAHVSPAGLTMLAISFLIVTLGILPSLGEPRFRFEVQLE